MAEQQVTVNDLSFAAYAIMRGARLVIAKKLGKTFTFTFELNGTSLHTLRTDYITSESARFDATVRDLKKLLFSGEQ